MGSASDPASGIGDDTVAAELIAAVLDLDLGSGPVGHLIDRQVFIGSFSGHVIQITGSGLLPVSESGCHQVNDVLLQVIADGDIDHIFFLKGFTCCLDIAADSHDQGIRVLLSGPVQHLSGLSVSNICHRTGVDDIDVRCLREFPDLIAGRNKSFLHRFGFVLVDFASQGAESHGSSHNFISISAFFLSVIIDFSFGLTP